MLYFREKRVGGVDGERGRVIYILLKNNLNTQTPMK
tara:strand:- start:4 stop:111 length:108 start_codon:yes stop_codon:yes gene_type:complete